MFSTSLRALVSTSLLLASFGLNAANYFKCIGPDGGIIFSDTECPDSSEVVTEKTLKSDALTGHVERSAFEETQADLSLEEMLLMRAQLADVITTLNPIRVAIEEHRLSSGDWAKSLHDLGFDPVDMTSSAIKQLRIGKQGKIIAKLVPSFGNAKLMVMSPQEIFGGTQYEWDCAANFSPLIMDKLPCESHKIHQ